MLSKDKFVKCMTLLEETISNLDAGFDAFGIRDAFDSQLYERIYKIEDLIAEDIGDKDDPIYGHLYNDFITEYKCGKNYGEDGYICELPGGKKLKPVGWEEFYDCIMELNK